MADRELIPDDERYTAELRELLEAHPAIADYASRYADYLAIGDVEPKMSGHWETSDVKAATKARSLLRHEWSRRVWGRK